jgi:hypothetical protein
VIRWVDWPDYKINRSVAARSAQVVRNDNCFSAANVVVDHLLGLGG